MNQTQKQHSKEEYKAEGLRRTKIRKANRLNKWSDKVRTYGRGSAICPYCDSYMSWCSCCQMWSSTCCQDYGTCQCS